MIDFLLRRAFVAMSFVCRLARQMQSRGHFSISYNKNMKKGNIFLNLILTDPALGDIIHD
jgi:hypothetical protein